MAAEDRVAAQVAPNCATCATWPRRSPSRTLPRPNLLDAKFDWRGQEYSQRVPNIGQKLVPQVAVVHQFPS